MEISPRGTRLRVSQIAQRRGDVKARADSRVVEAPEHDGVDVLGNTQEGMLIHVHTEWHEGG
jgi:hypothetical protein